jgi:GTP-binding protein
VVRHEAAILLVLAEFIAMLPVIALVGCPNVGKSTLFNRMTRSRDAIVAEFPGLTRDRQYGKGAVDDFDFLAVDTGGLTGDSAGIDGPMADQARLAIDEADLVLFLVDAKAGLTAGDEAIVDLLRVGGKTTLLVANKVDGQNPDLVSSEFASLGMGESYCISATHGMGVGDMLQEISRMPLFAEDDAAAAADEPEDDPGIKIAVVGRPNVGKSTLVNRMLGEERVVVFDEAGTTRDSIYIPFEREEQRYTLIDTAGVRRRGKISQKIEKFSVVKTLSAIEDSNVVILMLDAREGVVDQDLHLLGHVVDSGRALIITLNKWDGLTREDRDHVRQELERRLTFIDYASIHFISALHGSGVGKLYKTILSAYASATQKLKTNELNIILEAALLEYQPPLVKGRRIKLRYAHSGGNNPPTIIIHGNQTESVPVAYRRYLVRKFREALKLEGTPIRVEFKTADNPFKGRKNKLTDRQVDRRRRLMGHVKQQKVKEQKVKKQKVKRQKAKTRKRNS